MGDTKRLVCIWGFWVIWFRMDSGTLRNQYAIYYGRRGGSTQAQLIGKDNNAHYQRVQVDVDDRAGGK